MRVKSNPFTSDVAVFSIADILRLLFKGHITEEGGGLEVHRTLGRATYRKAEKYSEEHTRNIVRHWANLRKQGKI